MGFGRQVNLINGTIYADDFGMTGSDPIIDPVAGNADSPSDTEYGPTSRITNQNVLDRPVTIIPQNTTQVLNGFVFGDAAGAQINLRAASAASTRSSIAAATNTQQLGLLSFGGAISSAFASSTSAYVAAVATQNFSSGNQGTKLVFGTTPNASSTSASRMVIGQDGAVLVNTTSPGLGVGLEPKLEVTATNNAFAATNATSASNTVLVWNQGTSGDNGFIGFYTEASLTNRGSITYNRGGGVVAYNTTSDARLKENIEDAEPATELLKSLQVRKFNWKETGNPMPYGFIAQELHQVFPLAVSPGDEQKYWGVDNSLLVPMLIKTIQELEARITTLEANNG